MPLTCCDTSFLVSFYGNDVHTARAKACMARLSSPLTLSVLNEFEYEQSLRFAEWRGVRPPAEVSTMLSTFRRDLAAGRAIIMSCDLSAAVAEAARLSATYTVVAGHRAFDILQIATALHLGATNFLTFDANQRKLAQAERLKVAP